MAASLPLEFEGYILADDAVPTGDPAIEAPGDAPRALDQAFDMFVAVDATGVVTAWNRQAERRSGWARSEAVGQDLIEFAVEPEYRDAARRRLQDIAKNHVSEEFSRHRNLRVVRRDGTSFPVEVNAWASHGDDRVQG
jgi:PAS domain S-box-containing protein